MIYLIRGLPGSGKTTLANVLEDSRGYSAVVAADDFFTHPDGTYNFDPSKLPEAHAACQERAKYYVDRGWNVIVHNTFSCRWEMEPYLKMGSCTVIDLYDAGCTDEELFARGAHGVPLESIAAMRARWEHDWKAGDPRPPWERS